MAAVEKLRYAPLINHLKDNEYQYNFLLSNYDIRYGTISGESIAQLMVSVIEPLVEKILDNDLSRLGDIIMPFFNEILRILGANKIAIDQYIQAWKLLYVVPELFSQKPNEVLKVIDAGVKGVLKYQPKNLKYWCELMTVSLHDCKHISDLKAIGRISAWISGLSHLREGALHDFKKLPELTKSNFQSKCHLTAPLIDALKQEWYGNNESFEIGGFIGFNVGLFKSPPVVTLIDNIVMSTDGEYVCAVFKDICGTVVLNELNYPAEIIKNKSNTKALSKHKKSNFSDISSCVTFNDSLIITRTSSHKIYVIPV